ncbi:unnamed protein product [Moneuplotes crassus]|uniref:Uncharacterized protein n=1 Tax=Euplotes crassus TaxID=5936 RepID=A0AAD1US35_EUPCR|nr:unnamed protein product [Moneuplotes crassus]
MPRHHLNRTLEDLRESPYSKPQKPSLRLDLSRLSHNTRPAYKPLSSLKLQLNPYRFVLPPKQSRLSTKEEGKELSQGGQTRSNLLNSAKIHSSLTNSSLLKKTEASIFNWIKHRNNVSLKKSNHSLPKAKKSDDIVIREQYHMKPMPRFKLSKPLVPVKNQINPNNGTRKCRYMVDFYKQKKEPQKPIFLGTRNQTRVQIDIQKKVKRNIDQQLLQFLNKRKDPINQQVYKIDNDTSNEYHKGFIFDHETFKNGVESRNTNEIGPVRHTKSQKIKW